MVSGNPNDLLLAESFHGTIIAWVRQAGMFQVQSSLARFNPGVNHDDAALESTWKSWTQAEEAIRVVLALRIHDSEFAAIFHHEPLLRHYAKKLPQCCPDESFNANTALKWRDVMVKMQQHGCRPDQQPLMSRSQSCDDSAAVEMMPLHQAFIHCYALLAGLVAEICELRCGEMGDEALDKYRGLLMAWQQANSTSSNSRENSNRDDNHLMVLWHEAFMFLYLDMDLLERFLGRDGTSSTADQDAACIRDWVASPQGSLCAMHAMLVYKRLETLPIITEPGIHVPKALFYAGLVIYTHVKFQKAGQSSHQQVIDCPELSTNDFAPRMPHPPQSILGQPDSTALYNTADILRRQGHWGLSRRFAWILDALIDSLADSTVNI